MRRSLAKFSESEVSNHTPSLADFTTTTPELKFSVHTGSGVGVLGQLHLYLDDMFPTTVGQPLFGGTSTPPRKLTF
jgi:hypothetical protein